MNESKKAILVVSFGTSYVETRKKTIEKIEQEIQAGFPESPVYRAWTSGMIRKKLLKRDGLEIHDVKSALEQILSDGYTQVVVQPTHVMNGIENDQMIADVKSMEERFEKISIGDPLLTSQEDQNQVIEALVAEFSPKEEEVLVFMGHGTEHFANSVYAALDYQFKDKNMPNIHMGTVEAYPDIDAIIKKVRIQKPTTVYLAPFMIVAGDHANNDLCGEEDDSWKSRFESEGFQVSCILKGLGEYPGIRKILLKHAQEAAKQLEE